MARPRQRVCLQSGLKLDINQLRREGSIQPGEPSAPRYFLWTRTPTGERVATAIMTSGFEGPEHGWIRLQIGDVDQRITLRAEPRPFGGRQWYFVCPYTHRRCSVLWLPPGATRFGSRHAWGRQVAYASQFESPPDRAHRGKAKIKERLIADQDPAAWELPPKPKWMRWSTYLRLEERFDLYEGILEDQMVGLVARLMARHG